MQNEYRNPNIMLEAIMATTDKLLEWFDITEFCNFNILIRINEYTQKCVRMTYFELFQKVLTQGSGYDPYTFRPRNGIIVVHPRYERFMRWAGQERIREEYEKRRMEVERERIEMMLGGGRDLFNQSSLVLPVSKPEKKSWVRKIKEKSPSEINSSRPIALTAIPEDAFSETLVIESPKNLFGLR